jgi:4-hydroxybenzoate polyprenyltransferase
MKKTLRFARFLRHINLIMVFAVFWIFEYFLFEPYFATRGLGLLLNGYQLDLLALNTVLVALAGYVINDWYDREIDAVNKPERFLVAHPIPPKLFYTFYIGLLLAGFSIAVFLAIDLDYLQWLWLYPVFTFGMWYYAATLKKKGIAGNILVSLAIAFIPWLLIIAELQNLQSVVASKTDGLSDLFAHLLAISALMFLSNLARELLKDAEDAEGDASKNSASVFLTKGLKKTRKLVFVIVLALLGLEVLLLSQSSWMTEYFVGVGSIVVLTSAFALFKVRKMNVKQTFTELSVLLKLIMLFGMIQVLFLMPR